jgi:hypothetical protein
MARRFSSTLLLGVLLLAACESVPEKTAQQANRVGVRGIVVERGLILFGEDCGHGDLFINTFTFFGFAEQRLLGTAQPSDMIEIEDVSGESCQILQPYRVSLPRRPVYELDIESLEDVEAREPVSGLAFEDLKANGFRWDVVIQSDLPRAKVVCEGDCQDAHPEGLPPLMH